MDGVLASLQGDGDGEEEGDFVSGRETLMASNPGFSAVPSAFARALPSSTVVGVGVNDPKVTGNFCFGGGQGERRRCRLPWLSFPCRVLSV